MYYSNSSFLKLRFLTNINPLQAAQMKRSLVLVLIGLWGFASAVSAQKFKPDRSHPLVGTWQLEEWRAQDSLGNWQEPFGSEPRGYFVYGSNGHLSIQIMHADGGEVSDCEPPTEAADKLLTSPYCYVGYFGTYQIRPEDSVVVHKPKGGTLLDYIDTDQPRDFEISGDSLWIERSQKRYTLLLRVEP